MRVRRKYTNDDRREAVRRVEASGRPVDHMARELDLTPSVLHRWMHLFGQAPKGFSPSSNRALLEKEDIGGLRIQAPLLLLRQLPDKKREQIPVAMQTWRVDCYLSIAAQGKTEEEALGRLLKGVKAAKAALATRNGV